MTNKTLGGIYLENKTVHDKHAERYIDNYLSEVGNTEYYPFTMKTYHQRTMVRRVSKDTFVIFEGLVKHIEERDRLGQIKYLAELPDDAETKTKEQLIASFGFAFSENPSSPSNQEIASLSPEKELK